MPMLRFATVNSTRRSSRSSTTWRITTASNTIPWPTLPTQRRRSGDPEKLEAYIASLNKPPYNETPSFDQLLARAFFAGQRKDADAALKALRAACDCVRTTDDRPVMTEYQYAEACEWLYQDTGDPRFIAELLDWARKQQTVQPTMAWAYSMQYQYEKPGAARTRALAMTEYLDPASPRITKASQGERAIARAWLAHTLPSNQTPRPVHRQPIRSPGRIPTLPAKC